MLQRSEITDIWYKNNIVWMDSSCPQYEVIYSMGVFLLYWIRPVIVSTHQSHTNPKFWWIWWFGLGMYSLITCKSTCIKLIIVWFTICSLGGRRRGTHILMQMGMCCSNGSLFYKKSLNMGPVFTKKSLNMDPILWLSPCENPEISQNLWKMGLFCKKNP